MSSYDLDSKVSNRGKSDFDHPKNKWKVVHSEADDFAGYKGRLK